MCLVAVPFNMCNDVLSFHGAIFGVWFLVRAIECAVGVVSLLLSDVEYRVQAAIEDYAIHALAYAAIAVYSLLGAPHLVGMTYGHRIAGEPPATEAPEDRESG